MSAECFFPADQRLIRTLRIHYYYRGYATNHAPSSYERDERRAREDALLAQYPHSGYAEKIRADRALEAVQPDNFDNQLTQPLPGQ